MRPGSTIRTACAAILRALFAAAVLMAACLMPAGAAAQSDLAVAESGGAMPMVRTESPRQTLATFMRLRDALEAALAAYYEDGSIASSERLDLVADQMRTLFDLSEVPAAARREVGIETATYVLDILGRIGLPNLDDAPDLAAVAEQGFDHYAIPGTPFRLVRIEAGPRTGEFLFSARTVDTAPWFFRGVEALPLHSTLPFESWVGETRQLAGPLIPASLVAGLPGEMKRTVLGTPVWKIVAAILLTLVGAALVRSLHRALLLPEDPAKRRAKLWRSALSPLAVAAASLAITSIAGDQIRIGGQFALGFNAVLMVIGYLALAWAVWCVALAIFESFVRRSDFPEEDLDADLLRLVARMVGVIAIIAVLISGAQAMGLPVVSVLAGLGIGGLAVALAIRPTLENLIGGFILYLDKPIRVGDFCGFGTQSGTVESIGVRSTQIRALDRTLISVPNAQFADMQIVNWAQCDQMLIQQTIGLRHETASDQLRYVLAKIREMFHAHPRIDADTVRVRFAGNGPSSLDIQVRVYARTREWNDFYAIQEDVLLRIRDIVEQSGTGFAFPSQTVYLGRDAGLDAERGEKAGQEVAAWRRTGRLPFPRFAAGTLERLSGTLHYPPPGSPDFNATEAQQAAGEERLSAEPQPRSEAPQPEPAMVKEKERS